MVEAHSVANFQEHVQVRGFLEAALGSQDEEYSESTVSSAQYIVFSCWHAEWVLHPINLTIQNILNFLEYFPVQLREGVRDGHLQVHAIQCSRGEAITFLPTALGKANNPSYFLEPIVVPAYPHDKRLCVVRALKFYLALAETRTDDQQPKVLLRCLVNPFNLALPQIISKWIICLIRMAYEHKPLPLYLGDGFQLDSYGLGAS